MPPAQLKANFAVEQKYGAFYTGGKIQLSRDGKILLCQCDRQVKVVQIHTGKVHHVIGHEDEGRVTCFSLSPDGQIVVVAYDSLVLKQWNLKGANPIRTWRAIHTGPVSCMSFDCTSTLLVTGGSDATVRVWDVIQNYCTHCFRGHQGVISVAEFHPNIELLQLFTAGEDGKIRVWSLQDSSCVAVLDSHYSRVTALQVSPDYNTLYSGGRDNVVTVWNLKQHERTRVIPVYEFVEGLVLVPPNKRPAALNILNDDPYLIVGGSKGVLRVFNARTASCVFHHAKSSGQGENPDQSAPEDEGQAITGMSYNSTLDSLLISTYDHLIAMYKLEDFSVYKQYVGHNDDVLDIQFMGPGESHIAVVTNSEVIRVFELSTWQCQLLYGHKAIVLALDVSHDGHMLASASRDKSLRLWKMDPDTCQLACVAVCHGHTNSIPAVAFSRLSMKFLVSGSEDLTLKLWQLPDVFDKGDDIIELPDTITEKAHDKDVNALVVAPNDKFIASASRDKTAKLWRTADLTLLGVFSGHRGSIWSIQFSPVDQCVATSSADGTIKIWSLSDFSCVKTFEGHECPVLKVKFLTRGMQLVSSGSDGLWKLWTIKTTECVKTFAEHERKMWALAVNKSEDMLITGAEDSTIITWKDVTVQELEEARQKQEDLVLQKQELGNLIHAKKYLKAIGLAITLEQPFTVLSIIKEILGDPSGKEGVEETLKKLRTDQIDAVLRFSAQWNLNSKHCHVAQFVLSVLLKTLGTEILMSLPNFKSSLEAIKPYTERHFARMDRLMQQSMFVEYTWQCMRRVANPGSSDMSMEIGEESNLATAGSLETDAFTSQKDTESDLGSSTSEDEIPSQGNLTSRKRPASSPGKPYAESTSEEELSESDDSSHLHIASGRTMKQSPEHLKEFKGTSREGSRRKGQVKVPKPTGYKVPPTKQPKKMKPFRTKTAKGNIKNKQQKGPEKPIEKFHQSKRKKSV